jgi:hypothetical protein
MATSALIAIAKAAQQSARQKRRGNNFFDLAFRHKDYGGSGRIYSRYIWKKYWTTPNKCDCYWIIDKVVETCRVRIDWRFFNFSVNIFDLVLKKSCLIDKSVDILSNFFCLVSSDE